MKQKKASDKEKEALEKYLFQFLSIGKTYHLLPGIENQDSLAGLMGIEKVEYLDLQRTFRENANKAALELLKEEETTDWLNQLPFGKNDTIVALGDSSTDDLQGWFEIFKYLLEISKPEADFTFINSGVSNNTTADALRRLTRDVLAHEPDWVLISLGTFDTQRLSFSPARTLISLTETWENLSTIDDAIATVTENPPIWITPVPVIPGLLEEMELFEFTIDDRDLAAVREIILGKRGYIVDPLGRRMGYPPEAWYYLSDGLNPSLSGHVNTVRELLRSLATAKVRNKE
jgi:lysophospholipase L1-like esterase